MNIDYYFGNKTKLEKQIDFFIEKKQLRKINENKSLIISHIEKAKHNMAFFDINKNISQFNDWLIVTLYYALYHSALALVVNKNYISKNHSATILFLMKHYIISREEIRLIEDLSIGKEDAELYTELKNDRHNASYSTKILFTDEKIKYYKDKVINFILKAEGIIEGDMKK